MNFRVILLIILGFFIFNSLTYSHAYYRVADGEGDEITDSTRRKADSLREARTRVADSIKNARAYQADSIKLARKYTADSIQMVRKFKADSAAAVRKYRDSKQYKDSVANARKRRATGGSPTAGLTGADSARASRKHIADSTTAARVARTDSIHTVQKRRADSLAAVKKYKASKRFSDSVSIVRHDRMDSVHKVQQAARDKIADSRKHTLDSAKNVRKHQTDSIKTVRTKHMDSLKVVRKTKTDSLAKVKADKEKMAKAKEKKKLETNKLKLELKLKQKHEAWSNKSMLKKRWSPVRRVAQNSFTHYNYYFNANRKMEEAELNMQRSHHDNFDSLIGLYPYDPNRDSLLLAADMDSIIRKVSVGIQIHDPRVKWSNDMYLLLGEAYYYKGNYENASIAFRYIIASDAEKKKKEASASKSKSKEEPSILEAEKKSKLDFLKHKSVHNEAVLWLARTYSSAHQAENAESILSLLETDVKLPDDLKGEMAVQKANVYLAQENYPEASKQLSIAADDPYLPHSLRMRAAFLNGQIQQNMNDHHKAAASFEQVLTYYPKLEMDFYSRKYAALNRLQGGQNFEDAARPLKKILNDGKYTSYYDQVYYALGQLSAEANRRDEAISYYSKSINTPRATRKQKALSFSAMGDMYYASGRYANAKKAYDSAAKYTPSAAKDKNMVANAQKSKGLAEISVPATIIHDQDSLLALASMSKKDQQAAVRRYLRMLEQQKKDSAANAEASGGAPPEPEAGGAGGADASNWYFSNPALVQQGAIDFKRKWGNRPLTDNWRRSAATLLASSGGATNEEESVEAAEPEGNQMSESALLAKIPTTQPQKDAAIKIEQKAYIQLAKAYVKQLEDYKQAIHTLDTLVKRYPNHSQKEEELYLRYQIAVKQNKLDLAQKYSEELISKFPNSQYAALLRPRKSESGGATTEKPVATYFDETYSLLMQHQYTEALMRINNGRKMYDDPRFAKRFDIAEASAYAGMGNYDKADTVISTFLRNNVGDSLTIWAMGVKNYIGEVRNGGKPSWYKETPPGAVAIAEPPKPKSVEEKTAAKEVPVVKSDIPAMYAYQADSPHYGIIVLPGLDSRTGSLKSALKAFNSSGYPAANLDMLFDMYDLDLGVLVIKKFANAADVKAYIAALLASSVFKDYKPEELHVMAITASNYKKMFADKVAAPYYSFYSAYYK